MKYNRLYRTIQLAVKREALLKQLKQSQAYESLKYELKQTQYRLDRMQEEQIKLKEALLRAGLK